MLRSRAPALFFLTPALAAAAPFPPGLEHDLLALLAGDLPGGCARAGVSIQSFAVDVKVACGLDTGTLRLLDRDDADASGEIRRTLSFSILAQGDVPAVRNAERALADRIAARDDGTVHRKVSEKAQPTAQVHTSAPPDSWSSARKLGPLDDARRAASWLALIGLLVWLTASVFSAHPERRPEAPESKGALL